MCYFLKLNSMTHEINIEDSNILKLIKFYANLNQY